MSTSGPYVVKKFVRFCHCDPAGIIFYPQYFVLAHDCKEDWFREAVDYPFQNMVTRDRRGFPIVKLEAEFMRPSRLGDEIAFEITVRSIGASSLGLDYRCYLGDEQRMKLSSTLVHVDLDAGKPVPIPDSLRERLSRFMAVTA